MIHPSSSPYILTSTLFVQNYANEHLVRKDVHGLVDRRHTSQWHHYRIPTPANDVTSDWWKSTHILINWNTSLSDFINWKTVYIISMKILYSALLKPFFSYSSLCWVFFGIFFTLLDTLGIQASKFVFYFVAELLCRFWN